MTHLRNGARNLRPGQQFALGCVLALTTALGLVAAGEVKYSLLQARYLSQLAGRLTFQAEPGPSSLIRFPDDGPYDRRLGYSLIPSFVQRLTTRDFVVVKQARISPQLARLDDLGLFAAYREKDQAGLQLWSDDRQALHNVHYPERVYGDFETVPPLLIDALLFIENRSLLDTQSQMQNPSVEWLRFGRAVLDQIWRRIDSSHDSAGGSTLATQIEKYRHSPEGRTASPHEKLRQMASASVRAYLEGRNTLPARRQLVVDYLNTVPLSAKSGYGEIHGIGDGLWAWYGREFSEVNRLLNGTSPQTDRTQLLRKGEVLKQALSLIVAQRRPSYYLLSGEAELESLTNSYLRVMSTAGLLSADLRDAALQAPLRLRQDALVKPLATPATQKASTAMRTALSDLIGVPGRYDLDRLDLSATSTLNGAAQAAVTKVLQQLDKPENAHAAGLYGFRLLRETDDPSHLVFSFVLFERGENANYLRVQTDSVYQPFDINSGAKLDLGSTAKLRTLITYLQIVAQLHQQYAQVESTQLLATPVHARDFIAQWALDYLAHAKDRSLRPMLEASLEREYSASPGEAFYTGGGLHTFENFDSEDNYRIMPVREAFRNSVNLVFIRMMRDIARHYMFTVSGSTAKVLADTADPRRKIYLQRFADREGSTFLNRFHKKYRGIKSDQAWTQLLQGVRPATVPLATAYLSITPHATFIAFAEFMRTQLPDENWSDEELHALFEKYGPDKFSLADRGYITGVHPLELWLVNYRQTHPDATLKQTLAASSAERQAIYAWLFRTRYKNAQDRRIQSLLELEAFLEIARAWQRLGYPFASITPSYAAAIGAAGDRPMALAELMGIIVNKGMRLPNAKIQSLDFAVDTPYETHLEYRPQKAVRVLPEEIAEVVRGLLIDVVENGTAARLKGGILRPDGSVAVIGGKTGTGDHRFDVMARGGWVLSSRVIDRSATFVFMIDDRFFGTITTYVHEPYAGNYSFTSALSAQLLKAIGPTLTPLLDAPPSKVILSQNLIN